MWKKSRVLNYFRMPCICVVYLRFTRNQQTSLTCNEYSGNVCSITLTGRQVIHVLISIWGLRICYNKLLHVDRTQINWKGYLLAKPPMKLSLLTRYKHKSPQTHVLLIFFHACLRSLKKTLWPQRAAQTEPMWMFRQKGYMMGCYWRTNRMERSVSQWVVSRTPPSTLSQFNSRGFIGLGNMC
jgi:hypothetical protein